MTDRVVARANLLEVVGRVVKTLGTFDLHLWAAALAMFRTGDVSPFLDVFVDEIRNQLTRAWNEGARSVGVEPDEMTPGDLEKLEAAIEYEYQFVLRLAQAISDARMSNMLLDDFRSMFHARIDMWTNRYREMVNTARIWFGGKEKLMWVRGPTSDGCAQCIALNGIVAYAEEWMAAAVKPAEADSKFLGCRGYHCLCGLHPTNQRRSPRALNSILGIILKV